jgi:hypothetical protein
MTTFILSNKFRQNIVNFNESMARIAFFMLWKFQRKTDQMHVQMKLAVLPRRVKPKTVLLLWRGELLGHELFTNLVHMLQKFYVSLGGPQAGPIFDVPLRNTL